MARNVAELASRLEALLEDRGHLNLHAQAHARALLSQLETPPRRWPRFIPTLDERLLHSSHLLLVRGMELIDDEDHGDLALQLLVRGAESLEFVTEIQQSRLSQTSERVNAAIGYHVAGHHARAYVLASRLTAAIDEKDASDPLAPAVLALLRKDLRRLSTHCHGMLVNPSFGDASIASRLREGEIGDDDSVSILGRRSLVEAMLLYLEYVKRGTRELLDDAQERCRSVAELGREAGHVDLWWLGFAIEKLLGDLGDSSLWEGIGDLIPAGPHSNAIRRYIEAGLGSTPAVVTLWPSQRKALEMIKSAESPSFCIRMPTSAGKTKIAEFCLLRTLLEARPGEDVKCMYIAPFRALAVEIESTLSRGLRPLGIRVSEIYGGFDLTATDERLIQETQVLVATPEKFDAVIRLAPDLLDNVRLVIVDEGHIAGEISERGIRAEFLINRLLWRLGRANCRHVFISAVLPNPKEFAQWIGGDEDKIVESEWRPSRLVFGECEWNGSRARVAFTHEGSERLEQEVFVQSFVRSQAVEGLPDCGRRRNPFPYTANETFAACAVRFSAYGTTLAFVPQARQVDSTARTILMALRFMRALAESNDNDWDFPVPDASSSLMKECLVTLRDELGAESEIEAFLRNGIAVHRGSLPSRVKIAIERLIRAGEVRLIVATTTLGQGVNLPIRTVLVRGLRQGQHAVVSPMTFWNIAGRAGRAMRENEGQVLFFNDTTRNPGVVYRQRRSTAAMIDRSAIQHVIGLLHRVLKDLTVRWRRDAPDISFADLCIRLVEDDFDWTEESARPHLRYAFSLIDQHLLAISIEGAVNPVDPDRLQSVLRESLLFAQLDARPIDNLDRESAQAVLMARLNCVFRRVPQPIRREQFYRMGMSLKDCETIEAARSELLDLLRGAATWLDASRSEKLDLLLSLATLATRVDATAQAARADPTNVIDIVRAWLEGQRCVEMIANGLGDDLDGDAGILGRFLEEYCVYGLAWVISGLISFARREFESEGDELPPAAEHFPAMFKMGVCDPVAAALAPYLQMDRTLSSDIASLCPYDFTEISRAIAWMHSKSSDELEAFGMTPEDASRVISKRRRLPEHALFDFGDGTATWTCRVRDISGSSIGDDDPVIIVPRPDTSPTHFELFDLDGNRLGRFRQAGSNLPMWVHESHWVESTAREVIRCDDGSARLVIQVRALADLPGC